MRMEHKLTFPDLPITITQKTQTPAIETVSSGTMADVNQTTSTSTNTEQQTTKSDSTQTPPQPPPKPINLEQAPKTDENSIETSSIPKQLAFDFFMNKLKAETQPVEKEKYTSFQEFQTEHKEQIESLVEPTTYKTPSKLSHELNELNLEPGPPPEIGFMPKQDSDKQESISDKIQKLEETQLQLQDALLNSAKKMDLESKKIIEQRQEFTHNIEKLHEISFSPQTTLPSVVKTNEHPSGLVPGSPPEIGFMPKLEASVKDETVDDKIQKIEQPQQLPFLEQKREVLIDVKHESTTNQETINNQTYQPTNQVNGLTPGSPPEMGFMPKFETPKPESLIQKEQQQQAKPPVVPSFPITGTTQTIIKKSEEYSSKTEKTVTPSFPSEPLICNLQPGSPPEIGFIPKVELVKKDTEIPNQKEGLKFVQPEQAPVTEIKIFPFLDQKKEFTREIITQESHDYSSSSETSSVPIYRPQAILPHQDIKLIDFRSPSPRPSAEGIAMEKLWASHKPFDNEPSYQVQSPLTISSEERVETLKKHTLQETKKLFETKILEELPQESVLKAPLLVKQLLTSKPPQHDRPKSVAEIVPDIELEPGPTPEICFAQRSVAEPQKIYPPQEPMKTPTEAPPLPPRELKMEAPPVPIRPEFVAAPPVPKRRIESDYDSEHESQIIHNVNKYESETDESRFRQVIPPQTQPSRAKSTEPQPLAPSQFEQPGPSIVNFKPRHSFDQQNVPILPPPQELQAKQQTEPPKHQQPTSFNKGSGYMADTDEPFNHRYQTTSSEQIIQSSTSQFTSEINQSNVHCPMIQSYPEKPIPPAKHYRHHIHKHDKKDESSMDYTKVRKMND